MKNQFAVVLFLFFSFCVTAQQSSNAKKSTSNSKKEATTENKDLSEDISAMSLDKKLSSRVLLAYQDNSKTKVEDLFGYFQMLTDESLTDDFKKEVIENINQLFKNKNAVVIDFTSDSFENILLDVFIQKLLISEPILFTVSNEVRYNSVTYQSWKTGYTITRIKSGITQQTQVVQTVLFTKIIKKFGSIDKYVDQISLCDMK